MGNPKPSHRFPKGNKLGKPRPRVTDEVKAARKFNASEFEVAVSKVFWVSVQDLRRLVDAPGTPVMEALIGRIALQGIKHGGTMELNYFVERFLGKVAENHNFTGNAHPDLVGYITKINEEHAALAAAERDVTSGKENLSQKKLKG